jgi:cation:H+ antiporter
MVFQSSVPVALGLAFTSWSLDLLGALSAALAGGAYLYWLLRRKRPIEGEHLLVGGALYAVFVVVASSPFYSFRRALWRRWECTILDKMRSR